MKFKALSPLVAAVLLVAITMTIAGMLAFWASSFIKQQTTAFENQTQQTSCSFANLEVFDCSYDESTGKLTLVLQNIGGVELRNLTANLFYDKEVEAYTLPGTLGVREFKTYTIANLTNKTISKVIVTSKECPNMPGASAICS